MLARGQRLVVNGPHLTLLGGVPENSLAPGQIVTFEEESVNKNRSIVRVNDRGRDETILPYRVAIDNSSLFPLSEANFSEGERVMVSGPHIRPNSGSTGGPEVFTGETVEFDGISSLPGFSLVRKDGHRTHIATSSLSKIVEPTVGVYRETSYKVTLNDVSLTESEYETLYSIPAIRKAIINGNA